MIKYEFNDWHYSEYEREGGHMIVSLVVFASDTKAADVKLIYDTGAYVTVFSRTTAMRLGLALGTGKPATLKGFNNEHGTIAGELIEIPRLMIGKYFVYNVKAVVPLEDVVVAEVLGENVLEYFNYVVDHDRDMIFYQKNSNPKPYVNQNKGIDLSCGKVLVIDE
jgi:predicted aspartyl protease